MLNGFVLDELPGAVVVQAAAATRAAGGAVFFDPGMMRTLLVVTAKLAECSSFSSCIVCYKRLLLQQPHMHATSLALFRGYDCGCEAAYEACPRYCAA